MKTSQMPIDEGKGNDVLYIHNGTLLIDRKEWSNAIRSNMDASEDYHTKWRQKDKHSMTSLTCGI